MPDHQPTALTCPACGAPLEFDGSSPTTRCKFCNNVTYMPGVLAASTPAPREGWSEVRRLAESGNLLEAIKQYRQLTGADLKDAKDAVEAMRDGRLAEQAEDPNALESADLERVTSEIRNLLGAGDKTGAIHKYRETFDVSLTRAKFAVEQIEAGGTIKPGGEYLSTEGTVREGATVARTGSRVGCIVGIAILLLVGGIMFFAFSQAGGPLNPRLYPSGSAILLPSEQDAPPDVVSVLYDPDKEARLIGRISADSGKLLWKSDPLPEGAYTDAIVQGDGRIYVAHDMDLLALNKADGSLAWRASMSDSVYSTNSLAFVDGRVLAMGLDQNLQVFEAGSGRLVWSRQLEGYDRSVRTIGGSVVVIDYIDDDYHFGMIFLDLSDGREQRILTPSCASESGSPSDSVRPDSAMLFDASENAYYVLPGSFAYCVQRVDATSGQVTWETTTEESFTFSPFGFFPLNTQDVLYFGSDSQLLAVDKSTGEMKTLLNNEDYEFLPLVVEGDRLYVRARRTRGTERFELWGVDLVKGEQAWQLELGKARPVDPPNEMSGIVDQADYGWTWRSRPGGLLWLEFQAEPNQIVLKNIASDGSASGEQTITLKLGDTDYYTIPDIIGWQGQIVYFVLDAGIYALDTSTGELLFHY